MPYKNILLTTLFILSLSGFAFAQQSQLNASEILSGIQKANTIGSALYIAAHPDDENTRLLTYLANERKVRTAYISLTRGDGGQNLIGPEKGPLLGLIRTQELIAARKLDGAEQYFTRANDFGYSKNAEETLDIWDREGVLADMVWVIRNFKPDIIINRFPTTGEGGHGHHTAASILGLEAFEAAADPNRFPEQLRYTQTWQAKRIMWNAFVRNPDADVSGFMKLDIGKFNPLLGKSYGEIAAESRSMHKSQGFGTAKIRGPIIEYFKHEMGDKAENDIFDGLDLGWKRIKGGENIDKILTRAAEEFNPLEPGNSVPLLIEAYKLVQQINDDYWKEQKSRELEKLIIAASGLYFEANPVDYFSSPGEPLNITATVINRSGVPFSLQKITWPGNADTVLNRQLAENEVVRIGKQIRVPSEAVYSTPYWLKEAGNTGMFVVNEQHLIGTPENEPPLLLTFTFKSRGQEFSFSSPLAFKWTDPVDGEKYRPFEILPPVTLNLNENIYLFTGRENSLQLSASLRSHVQDVKGTLSFEAPDGWKIEPASLPFELKNKGDGMVVKANLSKKGKAMPPGNIKAFVNIEGQKHSHQIIRVDHGHIPNQVLIVPAESDILPIQLPKEPGTIGYIQGAGDEVPKKLVQLGYQVDILTDYQLENHSLDRYDAIIVGIRAYNTNERMRYYYSKLMDYVYKGGNMIVQYSANNRISPIHSEIGPYPFNISRDRVTVEEAPVTITLPGHPVLNYPFKITDKDFEGWVQERGLYFADNQAPEYVTPLSMADPGEAPSEGSLLIAKHGKGHFMYTGLSFFRQLPAGVPGAYRLFINMISLKE